MAFTGVSVISDGNFLRGSTTPTFNAGTASGYHLLVVEGYLRSKAPLHHEPIRSRFFTVGGHRWCILYYPDGSCKDNLGFISLRLFHNCYCSKSAKAKFEFSFIEETEKQEPGRIRASRNNFEFKAYSSEGYDRYIKREALEISNHLKDGILSIRCDVVVAEEAATSPMIQVPSSDMQQNFTDLLLTGEGADVVFQVGSETIAAHRCILAARSAVFKASLFGPLKEGSTSTIVQIDDIHPTVFKAMLDFIYGDSLPAPDEDGVLLQQLLVAADSYGLPRLMAMCDMRLRGHIGVNTTTTILALAEQHGCTGLKEACYEFLRCPANLKAVVATHGFDHLCRSSTSAMKDLIVAVGIVQAPM